MTLDRARLILDCQRTGRFVVDQDVFDALVRTGDIVEPNSAEVKTAVELDWLQREPGQ